MNTHRSSRHLILQTGFLIAFPDVRIEDDAAIIRIEGWDDLKREPKVIDEISMPQFGVWESVFQVPMRVLNAPFRIDRGDESVKQGMPFQRGGVFELTTDWNYPFYGSRIGAFAKPVPALETPRGVMV